MFREFKIGNHEEMRLVLMREMSGFYVLQNGEPVGGCALTSLVKLCRKGRWNRGGISLPGLVCDQSELMEKLGFCVSRGKNYRGLWCDVVHLPKGMRVLCDGELVPDCVRYDETGVWHMLRGMSYGIMVDERDYPITMRVEGEVAGDWG
jgi:uncharacterized protein YbdZ (MbtH family)